MGDAVPRDDDHACVACIEDETKDWVGRAAYCHDCTDSPLRNAERDAWLRKDGAKLEREALSKDLLLLADSIRAISRNVVTAPTEVILARVAENIATGWPSTVADMVRKLDEPDRDA